MAVSFSSSGEESGGGHPLMLWLGDKSNNDSSLLLYPPPSVEPVVVTSPQEILDLVNDHYDKEEQFVGGMGEQDLGVWFIGGDDDDPLNHSELVQEVALPEIGLASLQVSLFAASPPDYVKATNDKRSTQDFGTLCGFIVNAVEEGMAVEVGVLEEYAGSARDLAISLGAQNVHVYPSSSR